MDVEKMIKRIHLLSLSCDLKTDEGVRHFHNGHEYVEIGGIKWATMNVGAEKPTDYGFYFQWGDTQGYTADQVGYSREGKKLFGWRGYKYGNGTSSPGSTDMTKYNNTDGKTVLDICDDAVRYHWGGSWRMPTEEEFRTLLDVATHRWVASYQGSGINGYLFVDKTDITKKIFFPLAGAANNRSVVYASCFGYYWSSSLCTPITISGRYLGFSSGSCYMSYGSRFYGFPVRGVVKK